MQVMARAAPRLLSAAVTCGDSLRNMPAACWRLLCSQMSWRSTCAVCQRRACHTHPSCKHAVQRTLTLLALRRPPQEASRWKRAEGAQVSVLLAPLPPLRLLLLILRVLHLLPRHASRRGAHDVADGMQHADNEGVRPPAAIPARSRGASSETEHNNTLWPLTAAQLSRQ